MPHLLDDHGPKIGAALCALSALTTFALCLWLFMAVAPGFIERSQNSARELVAEVRGER